jgi:superfamily I DNA/RNA helicase
MRLPKLDDLIQEQKNVFSYTEDEDLFVAGPPGSGKTSLAVMRGKYLIKLRLRVLLITRNRMLTALATQLSEGSLVATTMHSAVAKHYYKHMGEFTPTLNGDYDFDWATVFEKYGAITSIRKFDHIIIDEGQNLPPEFFIWAKRYGANHMTVFADEDQTTSLVRSSLARIKAAGLPDPIRLTRNHRNTPEIAAVAEHFHRNMGARLAPGVPTRHASRERPELWRTKTWGELAHRISTRLSNRSESIGVIVGTKAEAMQSFTSLRNAVSQSQRVSVYISDKEKGAEFSISILDPGVTILTGESAIGLEFDTVFLQDLARSLPATTELEYRRMYMLCARAKDYLILVNGPTRLSPDQVLDLPGPLLLIR